MRIYVQKLLEIFVERQSIYMNKIVVFWIYLITNLVLVMLCNQMQGTQNYVWVTRYMDFYIFIGLVLYLFGVLYWSLIYFCIKKNNKISPQNIFYVITALVVLLLLVSSGITHGEALRSILFFDRNDTSMDFFNSIQYGGEPYKNKTIYPALISAVYGFIGQFVTLEEITEHAYYIRESQIGQVLLVIYSVFLYVILFKCFFICKSGKYIEKIWFTIIMFFSLPFLFAMERGNSVLLALVFIFIFIKFYDSDDRFYGINVKYFAYAALGIATGIKISPAIFLLLLLRDKKYLETLKCIGIIALFFFVPFYFTDGNIFTLKHNLEYTVSLFQSFIVNEDGILIVIGNGAYVNLINTFSFLGRLTDNNYMNGAVVLNYVIFAVGVILIIVCKEMKKYEIYVILSGLLVIFPGFSAVYNLVYMAIPLIYFLDSKQSDNIFVEYVYSILFIMLFAPILNFRITYFSIFFDDAYPLRISTFIESLAILFLIIIVEIRGINLLLLSLSHKKHVRFGLLCMLVFSIFFMQYNSSSIVGAKSVEKFYPSNMSLGTASNGFYMHNGEYRYMEKEANIVLKKDKILEEGLVIRFAYRNDVESGKMQQIKILCNQKVVYKGYVDSKLGAMIYVEKEKLAEFEDSELLFVRIVNESDKDYCNMFIDYIGPSAPLEYIDTSTYLQDNTYGLWKSDNGLGNFMGKNAEFLLKKSALVDGLAIKFNVDNKLLLKNKEILKNIKIFCNDHCIKEYPIMASGNTVIVLQPYEVDKILKDINYISLEVNDTYCDNSFDKTCLNTRESSISILYVGKCDDLLEVNALSKPKMKEWNNVVNNGFILNGRKKYYLNTSELLKGDYEIIFEKSLNNAAYVGCSSDFNIVVDAEKVYSEKISYMPDVSIDAFKITKDIFQPDNHIGEIVLDLQNQDILFNEVFSGLQIKYFGSKQTNDNLSCDNLQNAYNRSERLKWERNKKCFFFNHDAEILFDREFFDGKPIIVKYEVPEFLFMANPDKLLHLGLSLNGKEIVSVPLREGGRNELVLTAEEYAHIIQDEHNYVKLGLTVDGAYNLYNMHLAGRNNNYDISLYVFYVGKNIG